MSFGVDLLDSSSNMQLKEKRLTKKEDIGMSIRVYSRCLRENRQVVPEETSQE